MKNNKDFVAGYVTDQLALVSHTLKTIDAQLEDRDMIKFNHAHTTLISISELLDQHVRELAELNDINSESSSIKISASIAETFTEVSGAIAGFYSKLRSEKVSKMLRDDYAALNFATLTYSMLFVTAKGLSENRTAEIASRHLKSIPPFIMELNSIIPSVIIGELTQQGFRVDESAEEETIKEIKEAWSTPPLEE
jgi:hypothetical protein